MNAKFNLIANQFQPQHCGKCDLLIKIGPKNIGYAVIDTEQNELAVLSEAERSENETDLLQMIDDLLETDTLLKLDFSRIKICLETTKFTFIPGEVYVENNLPDYAKFISPKQQSDVLINNMDAFGIKNIFAVDTGLQNALKSRFNNPQLFNQASPFIEGISKIYSNKEFTQLFLNFSTETFEAALIKNNQLIFYNFFEFCNADEFNYFLLMILQQFKLDTVQTRVTISGSVLENDGRFNRAKKYFEAVVFANSNNIINYPEQFSEMPKHTCFSLLSLNLCG